MNTSFVLTYVGGKLLQSTNIAAAQWTTNTSVP